ncbi:MAG: HisA/HisF-related TIM barrel protein, partial [Desulfobacterales bacterium]|nr:HisA/HisF-related TIM barrel protein [Desulfobacterales bacterium]
MDDLIQIIETAEGAGRAAPGTASRRPARWCVTCWKRPMSWPTPSNPDAAGAGLRRAGGRAVPCAFPGPDVRRTGPVRPGRTVCRAIAAKMKRRHPHVFGSARVADSAEVVRNWQQIKQNEKGEQPRHRCSMPCRPSLPGLLRAFAVSGTGGARAGSTGRTWTGCWPSWRRSWRNSRPPPARDAEADRGSSATSSSRWSTSRRFSGVHPETALAGAVRKFERRFRPMEQIIGGSGRELEAVPQSEKDRIWESIGQASNSIPMIAIIDYNAGNLTSVARAVAHLGFACTVTARRRRDPRRPSASFSPAWVRPVPPWPACTRTGLDAVLAEQFAAGTPMLGICLGTPGHHEPQRGKRHRLPRASSPGRVQALPGRGSRTHDGRAAQDPPHGLEPHPHPRGRTRCWRGSARRTNSTSCTAITPCRTTRPASWPPRTTASAFASVIGWRNLAATQFHLEKSGRPGLRMLAEFLRLDTLPLRNPLMLSKRIIPCLDVRDGRTTKGIRFQDNVDIGDPVDMARFYYEQGADEIVFYDITASHERRNIMIDVVRRVAETIFIPFSVG